MTVVVVGGAKKTFNTVADWARRVKIEEGGFFLEQKLLPIMLNTRCSISRRRRDVTYILMKRWNWME